MSIDPDALADRLTATTGGDTTGWLWPVLLRRLATGPIRDEESSLL